MKLIIRLIIIGGLTYISSPFTAWWICMVIAFTVCYISSSTGLNAFVTGFLGVGLVWMGHAWNLDVINQSSFSSAIVNLFPVDDPIFLVFITGLVGGLAGGFAALSGTSFKQLFIKEKKRSLYS